MPRGVTAYVPLFGRNLLVALDARGMTRAQLGQATSGNFVDAWIDGSRDPSLAELARLRAVLQVDLNWLITGFGAARKLAAREPATVQVTGEMVARAAASLAPLFRHGGGAGNGTSYGWNADAQGYGIWDHETDDWFADQPFPKDIRDIDGAAYFATAALTAALGHSVNKEDVASGLGEKHEAAPIDEIQKPDDHAMVAGSHECANGPECRCGAAWLYFEDRCATSAAAARASGRESA